MDEEWGMDASGSGPTVAATVDEDRPQSPEGRRPARLGELREQEILRAAYELLGEVGYAGLKFDAVAVRARASKATLYRHWSSKAELVAASVRACKASAGQMPDTGSLRGDLVVLLRTMAESMAGEDGPLFAGLVMAMRTEPEFATQMRAMFRSKGAITDVIVTRAIGRGEICPECDPNLIEEIAPAQLFMHSFARGEALDARYIDHLIDDILLPLLRRPMSRTEETRDADVGN
jgi:AcrR family transcriptional regulator